jgi:TPR repeat protein
MEVLRDSNETISKKMKWLLCKMLQYMAFFSLLCSFNSLAQNVVVKNVETSLKDASASTNPRIDENGISCALLKVFTLDRNVQFSGNVVGPVENKTNEYWVYLKKGSSEVNVSSPAFSKMLISFDDYGIGPLQSKVTYNMTLTFQENKQLSYSECKIAAESGSATDLVNLGKCYLYGIGINEAPQEAVRWFEKAARQGDVEAIHLIGDSYFYGTGNPRNYEIAIENYTKAANKGYAPAIYSLGVCYEQGKGVKQNMRKAIKYFKSAAEKGFLKAMNKVK